MADHTFYWVDIPGWLPKRTARQTEPGVWNVDDKLQLRVLGETKGAPTKSGIVGARRRNFAAHKGDVMQHTLCVYQPIVPGRDLAAVSGNTGEVHVGRRYTVTFDEQARPTITVAP